MEYIGEQARIVLAEILSSEDDEQTYYPEHMDDTGFFYDENTKKWIAFDNADGDCWIVSFYSQAEALEWVRKEITYVPPKQR